MKHKKFFLILLVVVIFGVIIFAANYKTNLNNSDLSGTDQEALPGIPVVVTPQDINNTSHDALALGGYNVLIADRGNNRIIEVTPDKKIVWEYKFNLPKLGLGADDAFFIDNGKSLIVNLEEYHTIEIIDYASKKVTWSYGVPGKPGSKDGMLNTPDDAYKLPNGNITVADIKNCRVIEIVPDTKKIVRQYGVPGKCKNEIGFLSSPNGDTPLPDGHTLISNIGGRSLVELDSNWKQIFTMIFPVNYPSDPQPTQAGNILISDYSKPGQIVEVDRQGNIVWQFSGQSGDVKLDHPSLAVELPNGNILANDDLNHRVIVIDKQTKKIIWQYGVTGKPGVGADQLNIPDGMDIIMRGSSAAAPVPPGPILKVGQVSRYPQNYVNKSVIVAGYVLKQENGYILFSDESTGSIGPYDLPVSGPLVNSLSLKQKYTLQGILKYQGLNASNHNSYHLELTNIF